MECQGCSGCWGPDVLAVLVFGPGMWEHPIPYPTLLSISSISQCLMPVPT